MGVFCIIGIIIGIFAISTQRDMDKRLTQENYNFSIRNSCLVYYDHISKSWRSTKTNQKAARFVTRDVNGEWYEYTVTVPLFPTIERGEFIEARYLNINKRNDPVILNNH